MCSGLELLWRVAVCGTGPSCGEQEAPHRPGSTVPAGREESLHLLQCLVSPSSRATLLLSSLASSGRVPYCGSGQAELGTRLTLTPGSLALAVTLIKIDFPQTTQHPPASLGLEWLKLALRHHKRRQKCSSLL
ncbi:hypothetical protein AOLI_G00133420 [Acnodon oligacanthus]